MTPLPRLRSPELMDAPDADARELARSLEDLQWVNRWLGGSRVALAALTPMIRRLRGEVRVLDVATGSADIPLALAGWARKAGAEVRIVATDAHAGTVAVATGHVATEPAVSVERADALALPYPDGAFHFAMCHTALHHFDWPDAVRVLHEMSRVATHGVVVTDLMRSRLGLLGVKLLATTVWRRHPITRHDGIVSIHGSFTPGELRRLAREAGLGKVKLRSYLFYDRMSMTADRARGAGRR